ncbi:hypothetical protein D3C87_616800 [compost metagenome]
MSLSELLGGNPFVRWTKINSIDGCIWGPFPNRECVQKRCVLVQFNFLNRVIPKAWLNRNLELVATAARVFCNNFKHIDRAAFKSYFC